MATLEHILAATEVLNDNYENPVEGSGSGKEENQIGVYDEKKDEGSAATGDVREQIAETETVVEPTLDSNNILDNNGVHSLSRVSNGGAAVDSGNGINVAADGVVRKTLNVDVDGCESGQRNAEKLENVEQGFRVGDFVWCKIKSHPWWPGQVYDLTTASEFAVKNKQEGRLLVAFFGDGSCSWCLPSQLKPFVENFRDMSLDRTSKSFVNAVQKAVDEIGRLVESEMTCGCVPSDKRDGLSRPMVSNAGIKEGVLAPEVDICRLSVPEYNSKKILSEVMHFAKAISFNNVLEVSVLRSWISAFYRAKGGCQLPVYHEPLLIEGMEDKSKTETKDAGNYSAPVEIPIKGPMDEDWLLSPTPNSKRSQSSPDDKVYYCRKQKSVAELMGENSGVKPKSREGTTTKNGKSSGKSATTRDRKKSNNEELAEDGNDSTQLASSTVKIVRKRKVEVLESPKRATEKVMNPKKDGTENGVKKSTSSKKLKTAAEKAVNAKNDGTGNGVKKGKTAAEKAVDAKNDGTGNGVKKGKTAAEKAVNAKNDGTGNGVKKGTSSKKPKKIEVPPAGISSDESEEPEIVSTPRERKKSKYLCPPYLSPRSRLGNSSFKMELDSPKVDLSASSPVAKVVEKSSDELVTDDHKKCVKANPKKVENQEKATWTASDVNVCVNDLLSDIQYAAVDHFYLSKEGSLDPVWDFISALRNSTYLHGENYKLYQKSTTDRKRKSLPSGQEKTKSASKKTDASKSKKAMEKPHRNASFCLILTFAPKFPLPSKEAIVEMFSKFGSVNEKETRLVRDSHSVQIVYKKDSDAETALKSSISNKPFGAKNVISYSLQHYPPDYSISSHKQVSNDPESDDFLKNIRVVRQKIDTMTAILENYQSRFSDNDKSGLKYEMKHLLENVETVSEKLQVVAEKSSS